MEYIFGIRLYDGKETEFVKTISDDYTNFVDGQFMTYTYANGEMTITHNFRILWKYKQDVDLQNNYNTWYYIDNHTKEIDKTPGINAVLEDHTSKLNEQSEVIDDIIIELLGE